MRTFHGPLAVCNINLKDDYMAYCVVTFVVGSAKIYTNQDNSVHQEPIFKY